MKFVVDNLTKCAPRLGVINNIQRLPNFKLETPAAILYTKGGSIPHITHEVLRIISTEPHCIQIPIVSTAGFTGSMSEFQGHIAKFVGLDDCLTCVTVQDPGHTTPSGHHLQHSVPVWTKAGKMYLNPESYMDIIESFKPDMYYVLSDGDTNAASAKKRISKAVDQTITFFNQCLERHKKSDVLKNSTILAVIEGGYCLKSREKCITEILKEDKEIEGFVIDGLHNNGPEVELLKFDEVKPVIEYCINSLPENKMRILHGCWNPVNIIKAVKLGVDIFDTSYLHILVKRACAITFNWSNGSTQNEYEINFTNSKYSDDFAPIKNNCVCLTCKKYSRAYLHHLINVQELLGPLLLMIHNTHHYLEFFKEIRKAIKNDTLINLENILTEQFESHQEKILGNSNA